MLLQLLQYLLLFVDICGTLRTMTVLRLVLRLLLGVDEVLILWVVDAHLPSLETINRLLEVIHVVELGFVASVLIGLVRG